MADLNVPTPDDKQTVICLYCNKAQEVGRKALSITCRFCHKSLKLEDLRFKEYQARRSIDTCGIITVEKRGHIVSDRILCGGMIVRGKIKGNISSRGPVLVGPEAEIVGDVIAPSIVVPPGAILNGYYEIGEKSDAPPAADL